ncbi:MAG TPA: hypothetical protein VI959_01240 [Alphaproteobacteria bacterium]|nr:hypothetical protein [Alphaproteobacteria bacterium]
MKKFYLSLFCMSLVFSASNGWAMLSQEDYEKHKSGQSDTDDGGVSKAVKKMIRAISKANSESDLEAILKRAKESGMIFDVLQQQINLLEKAQESYLNEEGKYDESSKKTVFEIKKEISYLKKAYTYFIDSIEGMRLLLPIKKHGNKEELESAQKEVDNSLKELSNWGQQYGAYLKDSYLDTRHKSNQSLFNSSDDYDKDDLNSGIVSLQAGEAPDQFIIGKRITALLPFFTLGNFMVAANQIDLRTGAPLRPLATIRLGNRLWDVYAGKAPTPGYQGTIYPEIHPYSKEEKMNGLFSHQTKKIKKYEDNYRDEKTIKYEDYFHEKVLSNTKSDVYEYSAMAGVGLGGAGYYGYGGPRYDGVTITFYFVPSSKESLSQEQGSSTSVLMSALQQENLIGEGGYEDLTVPEEFKQQYAQLKKVHGKSVHNRFPKPSMFKSHNPRKKVHDEETGEYNFAPLLSEEELEVQLRDENITNIDEMDDSSNDFQEWHKAKRKKERLNTQNRQTDEELASDVDNVTDKVTKKTFNRVDASYKKAHKNKSKGVVATGTGKATSSNAQGSQEEESTNDVK